MEVLRGPISKWSKKKQTEGVTGIGRVMMQCLQHCSSMQQGGKILNALGTEKEKASPLFLSDTG